jgi:hypothetical protein
MLQVEEFGNMFLGTLGGRYILTLGFRGFSLWSLGPVAFGPEVPRLMPRGRGQNWEEKGETLTAKWNTTWRRSKMRRMAVWERVDKEELQGNHHSERTGSAKPKAGVSGRWARGQTG